MGNQSFHDNILEHLQLAFSHVVRRTIAVAQLKESIAELQALTIKKLAQDPVGDMREIIEEAMAISLWLECGETR
jgi:hypothetical protein